MPASPRKVVRPPDPDREYVVLLSFLPLRRFRDFLAFAAHDARITRQLSGAQGLVGYSKLGWPRVKRFWTLFAWEDEAALQSFVQARSRARAMAEMPPRMGPTRFVRWTLPGRALPPTWEDALRRRAAGH